MSPEAQDVTTRYKKIQTLHVGILVFPDVEVLDFAGPFEVFSVAARLAKRATGVAPFTVSLIGAQRGPVLARHGMGVVPHFSFDDAPAVDLLIVPGGVVNQPLGDAATLDWVRQASAAAALTASVCTGAFILAETGLLDGLAVTTHWEDIPDLRSQFPELDVREDVPFVDQGRVVTSGGISAGIGMSLHLVQRVLGAASAVATARQMEYDWQPAA